jgi:hypothetical protein
MDACKGLLESGCFCNGVSVAELIVVVSALFTDALNFSALIILTI